MTDKPGAMCANCLHPVDRHTGDGDAGRVCGVEIAVTWSDGPDVCPCERCIPQGAACSIDGCGEAAVRYRVDASDQVAIDMCVRHYEEAEPYCERYYELTGGRRLPQGSQCGVDGCGEAAVHYRLGRDHARIDMCVEHFTEARPYRRRYYELAGGRPFPEGTPCSVGGCDGDAVQIVSDGGGGGGGGVGAGGGEHGFRGVCATHYIEAAHAAAMSARESGA